MLGIDHPSDGFIIKGKYAEKMRYELRKARDHNFVQDPRFEDFPNNYDGPDDCDDQIIDLTGMSDEQIMEALSNIIPSNFKKLQKKAQKDFLRELRDVKVLVIKNK